MLNSRRGSPIVRATRSGCYQMRTWTRPWRRSLGGPFVAGDHGGVDVEEARERAYAAVDRIVWPEGFCAAILVREANSAAPAEKAEENREIRLQTV